MKSFKPRKKPTWKHTHTHKGLTHPDSRPSSKVVVGRRNRWLLPIRKHAPPPFHIVRLVPLRTLAAFDSYSNAVSSFLLTAPGPTSNGEEARTRRLPTRSNKNKPIQTEWTVSFSLGRCCCFFNFVHPFPTDVSPTAANTTTTTTTTTTLKSRSSVRVFRIFQTAQLIVWETRAFLFFSLSNAGERKTQ